MMTCTQGTIDPEFHNYPVQMSSLSEALYQLKPVSKLLWSQGSGQTCDVAVSVWVVLARWQWHCWLSSGWPDWPLVFGTMNKWLSVLLGLPHSLLPCMP